MPPRITLATLDLNYFEGRTIYDHRSGCLVWTGATASGYGYLGIERKNYYAHRLAFFLKNGHWPVETLHSCDVKRCCAWWHLHEGTHSQNVREANDRGLRRMRPERTHTARLNWDSVREMRRLRQEGMTTPELARRFGVAARTAAAACQGVTWRE